MKIISTSLKIISYLALMIILSGCSAKIYAPAFLNPPPKFTHLDKNKKFSHCNLRMGGKSNEGSLMTFEFTNIKNNTTQQENIFFSVAFSENNPIWYELNVGIGERIIFKTEDGEITTVDLIKDRIKRNNIRLVNKTRGKIGYLSNEQVSLLQESDVIYYEIILEPGSQKRFNGHITGKFPKERMNIFKLHCLNK